MNCPRCRTPLNVQQAGNLVMNCCYQCGGLFLDGIASKRVVDAVDPNAIATANQVSQHARAAVSTDAVAPCPACEKPLDRMPIPAANVTVDVCREHGVWFDRDELQRVVQAVGPSSQQAPQPGQEQAGGWGVGKTALAVGGGLAAVAGVAYVASHTDIGKQAMGVGPHASGFGAVGSVLSKLF